MKVTFRDDIQDGIHITAVVRFAGEEWETQIDIDAMTILSHDLSKLEVKPKQNHLRKFICPACGKREMLDHRKRQYCDCNPVSPFPMYVDDATTQQVRTTIGALARSA